MHEIFSFRKELNFKKIIIVVLLIIFIIAAFLFFFFHKKNIERQIEIEESNPFQTFTSTDNSLDLKIKKTYGFAQYASKNNYILELRTENNLNVFLSSQDLIPNKDLFEVVSADIQAYIEEFNNYSNLSEVKEFESNGKKACTYSFHYLDAKTVYYLQVVWIEYNGKYYIFDIEFPLDSLSENSQIINVVIDNINFKH